MTFLFYIPYGEKKKKLVWKEIAIDFVITVWKWKVKEKVTQSCPVLCDLMNYYSPWNSPGQNTRVGSLSFLQGIFPIQGSNPGLPHCRWILSQLSHKGSPRILEWVAYPFSSGYSWTRNQTRVSCIAGGFFTNWGRRTFFSGVSSRRSCRSS